MIATAEQAAFELLSEIVFVGHLTHTPITDLLAMELPMFIRLRPHFQRLSNALTPKQT